MPPEYPFSLQKAQGYLHFYFLDRPPSQGKLKLFCLICYSLIWKNILSLSPLIDWLHQELYYIVHPCNSKFHNISSLIAEQYLLYMYAKIFWYMCCCFGSHPKVLRYYSWLWTQGHPWHVQWTMWRIRHWTRGLLHARQVSCLLKYFLWHLYQNYFIQVSIGNWSFFPDIKHF